MTEVKRAERVSFRAGVDRPNAPGQLQSGNGEWQDGVMGVATLRHVPVFHCFTGHWTIYLFRYGESESRIGWK